VKKDKNTQNKLMAEQSEMLLERLKARFEANPNRHPEMNWEAVAARVEGQPEKLWSLHEMEHTGGAPDVIGWDAETEEILFFDCSPESPKGRRSLCYDPAAWESRKANKPEDSAVAMAAAMGVELLTEAQYFTLQKLGEFDLKTSSWLSTPTSVRARGGAIFGDRRFGRVFIYHNGAESYYSARGFRCVLRV
jgi:hypothetical protein